MFTKFSSLVKKYWDEQPLPFILFLGLFFRLLAVIFSKGFGMLDDHFLIIEAAQSWVDKTDYNAWLPVAGQTVPTPSGHSFFYTGLHYLFFLAVEFLGLKNPQGKMYLVRLLHAFYSLITIYCGYKITKKVSTKNIANQVGLLLAIFWMMPFLSVRNLVEVACIPPLMLATWLAIKNEKPSFLHFLLIGFILGIGFNIRFQTILFTGGFGLALLLHKKIMPAIGVGIGFLFCALLVQGGIDMLVWHHPFVEFAEYVRYNLANSRTYYDQPWYNYLLLLLGILIPPISLFLFFGFFKNFKKHLLLFLPSFIFLVAHSYFPNKQERFILPIVPFFLMLGMIGWLEFEAQSNFWQTKGKAISKYCWLFFWSLNTVLLLVISVSYTKRNRVEAMSYLRAKGDVKNLIIEDSNRSDFTMSPNFYLGKWTHDFGITNEMKIDSTYAYIKTLNDAVRPNYIVFYQSENLENRLAIAKKYFTLKYETTVEPSFIDNFMYHINPNNINCTTYIYKIESSN